jgi:hypothetical protein
MIAVELIASTASIRMMIGEIAIGTGTVIVTGEIGTRKRIENGTGVTGGNRMRTRRNTGPGRSIITTASLIATEIGTRFIPRPTEWI